MSNLFFQFCNLLDIFLVYHDFTTCFFFLILLSYITPWPVFPSLHSTQSVPPSPIFPLSQIYSSSFPLKKKKEERKKQTNAGTQWYPPNVAFQYDYAQVPILRMDEKHCTRKRAWIACKRVRNTLTASAGNSTRKPSYTTLRYTQIT